MNDDTRDDPGPTEGESNCPECGGMLSADEATAGECAHADCNWRRDDLGPPLPEAGWAATVWVDVREGEEGVPVLFFDAEDARNSALAALSRAGVPTATERVTKAKPSERHRAKAQEWYGANPPEIRACPTMYAGDAMDIYARALADCEAEIADALEAGDGEALEHVLPRECMRLAQWVRSGNWRTP